MAASKALGSENMIRFLRLKLFRKVEMGDISIEEVGESDESERGGTEEDYFLENNLIRLKKKNQNHSGGILGGMSDGSEILIRASF